MTKIDNLKKQDKIIFYQSDDNNIYVDVIFNNETLWLSQKMMAELFDTSIDNISLHLKNIYIDEELDKKATTKKSSIVQKEGNRNVKREVEVYSLDAIIAVGYRVNSKKATKFRIWATNTLKEYITKGFVLNDELLKNGKKFGKDYFDELLERIRDIRASERRSYQKITDLFETCSADYDSKSEESALFFKTIQNKFHFAITGNTAAEIIYDRVDSNRQFMGLTTWKGSPNKKIIKSDVVIAKNYLNKKEIDRMNRLVVMFIDYAEFNALEENILTMKNWIEIADNFLSYNKQKVLDNAGTISHEIAVKKAEKEYDKYKVIQDKNYISDFDERLSDYLIGKEE